MSRYQLEDLPREAHELSRNEADRARGGAHPFMPGQGPGKSSDSRWASDPNASGVLGFDLGGPRSE